MFAKAGLGEDWKPQFPTGYAGFGIYPVADFESGTVGIEMLGVVEVDPELVNAAHPMFEFLTFVHHLALIDKYDLDYQLNRLILLQLVGHLRSENHLRRLGLSLLELV